jgi:hypothetical protein
MGMTKVERGWLGRRSLPQSPIPAVRNFHFDRRPEGFAALENLQSGFVSVGG